MGNSMVTRVTFMRVLGPLLMPSFPYLYTSIISFFTVVALYPDLTQHKKIISDAI